MSPRARPVEPPKPGGVREGAGRPAEAGVAREESLRVLVTPGEKAELIELAGGPGKLSALLRRAPAEAARWREVAEQLAQAIADGYDEANALAAYCALAETPLRRATRL